MEPVKPPEMPGKLPEITPIPQSAESIRQKNPERNLNNLPSVLVKGDKLGHLLILPGKTVQLADIFPDGKESYPEVYLRTASGNIYRLIEKGGNLNLQNANYGGVDEGLELNTKAFRDNDTISIGKGFAFLANNGNYVHSTSVLEAVIVEPEVISDPNRLVSLTKNTIVEDYESIIARVKIGMPQGK